MTLNVTVIRLVQINFVGNVSFKPFLPFSSFITIIIIWREGERERKRKGKGK